MDNNNMQNQPMNGPVPPVSGPVPPIDQPPYPPQPPYGQPPYGQPPVPPAPKKPMDPKKKKAIITWCCVGGGVLVLGIAAAIVLPMIFRVDYSTAYHAAGELQEKVYDIYNNYDCGYVTEYVRSEYTDKKTYDEYVTNCKATMSGTEQLIKDLENTDGVKKDKNLSEQFNKVKALIVEVVPNEEELSQKLNMYQVWHDWSVAGSDMKWTDADSKFENMANVLINSNIDAFKTYGEGWLEKILAASHAYQAYNNASYSASNWNALRDDFNNKKTEYNDWVTANKPDINTVASLNFADASKMYSEFNKFYQVVADTYEKNYNKGSGDCTEFLGEVVCE